MRCTPKTALKTGAPSQGQARGLLAAAGHTSMTSMAATSPASPPQLTPARLCQAGGVSQPRDRSASAQTALIARGLCGLRRGGDDSMAYVSLGSRSRPGFSSGGGSGGASGGGSAGYSSSGIGTSLLAAGRSASNASSDAMKPPAGKPCCKTTHLDIMPVRSLFMACRSAASVHVHSSCGPPGCISLSDYL